MQHATDLRLRYMERGDIPAVVEIDKASFDPPWPPRSYHYEVGESSVSYMVVLEKIVQEEMTGIKRLLSSLRGDETPTQETTLITGYGGLWKIADEAHVSTIASHPEFRGRSYGEILLAGMIRRSVALAAEYIILEVRVSNTIAQALYHKYNFEIVGTKKNYYRHDNEDAYAMRLDLSPDCITHFHTQYDALQARIPFEDAYSHLAHPRRGDPDTV